MSEEDFKISDEVKIRDGGNVYTVMEIDSRCVLLKCIWFGCKEDLGDLIFCTRENQEIWVALFSLWKFERISRA